MTEQPYSTEQPPTYPEKGEAVDPTPTGQDESPPPADWDALMAQGVPSPPVHDEPADTSAPLSGWPDLEKMSEREMLMEICGIMRGLSDQAEQIHNAIETKGIAGLITEAMTGGLG